MRSLLKKRFTDVIIRPIKLLVMPEDGLRRLKVKIGHRWFTVEVPSLEGRKVEVLVDGDPVVVTFEVEGPTSRTSALSDRSNKEVSKSHSVVRAPMPGTILSLEVKAGDPVAPGQKVCVLEAMKMEQALVSPAQGIIKAVLVQVGQGVQIGQTIAELE